MNEQIKLLAEQADEYADNKIQMPGEYHPDWHDTRDEKFAELIVQKCVGLCDQAAEENARTFYTVTETKEVGPALVAKGSQVQAEKLSKQIKLHFGVK